MDRLPEELQLRILEYLDSVPPSETQARLEPSLKLTSAEEHPLKSTSCLSKQWRRVTLPLLFRHACLKADKPVRRTWLECCLCNDGTLKWGGSGAPALAGMDQYHIDMLESLPKQDDTASLELIKIKSDNYIHTYEYDTRVWASRIYHASKDFVEFVVANRLQKRIFSFVLYSDSMKISKKGQAPSPIRHDRRYEASATMWEHLLSIIDPQRVAIVAPPVELACFCNSFVNTDAAWAFTDMDYHILELRQASPSSQSRLPRSKPYAQLRPIPGQADIAPSSVFHLRDWTSISLNEGSFLQAYGTYEYFERGPPSLVSSVASNLKSFRLPDHNSTTLALAAVRSFTYIAIFPFANHLDFLELLPQLETLDLQFAPDPQSGILDDRERTGRAELQDCWQELISGYHDVATTISTFRMSREEFPNLKTFICRDMRIPALKDDLDHIFTPLCLPVWAECTEGVFTRVADKAELPGMDDFI